MASISPYTTPADYKYMPMPFKELLTAGMLMDKNVNKSLKDASELNQDIDFMEGDINSARRVWGETQKKINSRVADIYKNPGSHSKHAKAFFELANEEKDPFGEKAALHERHNRETALKTSIKDSGWEGDEARFLEDQITYDNFDKSYDPTTGRAGEVTMGGYEVPMHMTGKDLQDRMNTILSNSKETLLSQTKPKTAAYAELKGIEPGNLDAIYTWGSKYGITKAKISKALAESVTPDMIDAAQLMDDSRYGKGTISEQNFYDPKTNAFDNETILGGMANGASSLASYERTTEKQQVVAPLPVDAAANKAARKAAEKKALIQPGGYEHYMTIDSDPVTPAEIRKQLEGDGTDDNIGINAQIVEYQDVVNRGLKNDPKVSASDAANAAAQIGYLNTKKKTLQEVMSSYKREYASAELAKMAEHNEGKEEQYYDGIVDEDYEPSDKADYLTSILHSDAYIDWESKQLNNVASGSGSASKSDVGMLRQYIREVVKDPTILSTDGELAMSNKNFNIDEDDARYLQNVISFDNTTVDLIDDINDVLTNRSDEIKEEAEELATTIGIELFPEIEGVKSMSEDDPDYSITQKIQTNPHGYDFWYMEDGKLVKSETPGELEGTYLERANKANKEKYVNTEFHAIGTTRGSDLKTLNGKPYIAVNLVKSGTGGKGITKRYLVAPKATSGDRIYELAEQKYEMNEGLEGDAAASGIQQAERIHNSKEIKEFKEGIGGYNIDAGEYPPTPIPQNGKYSENEYLFNLNDPAALRRETKISVPNAQGGSNLVNYRAPVTVPLAIHHGSDGTVKVTNFNNVVGQDKQGSPIYEQKTFSDVNGQSWQKAQRYAAVEKKINVATQDMAFEFFQGKENYEQTGGDYIHDMGDGRGEVYNRDAITSMFINNLIEKKKASGKAGYKWTPELEQRLRSGLAKSMKDTNDGLNSTSYAVDQGPVVDNGDGTYQVDDETVSPGEESNSYKKVRSGMPPPAQPTTPTTPPPTTPPVQQPANPTGATDSTKQYINKETLNKLVQQNVIDNSTPEPSPEIDAVIDPVMDFEKANGYGNYGLTSEQGNLTPKEAKKIYKQVYYPMVEDLPQALQIVGMDIDVNQRDHYSEMMIAAGDMTPTERKEILYGVKGDPDNMGEKELFSADGKKNKDYLESEMYEEWELGGKDAVMDAFNKDPEGFLDKLATERKRAYSTNGASQKQVAEWNRRVDESTARAKKSLKLGK